MCTQTRCGGACVDLQTSAAHCGACDRACMAANATPRCAMGVCGIGACTAGFADCDTMSANGCEVNTAADLANCGGCGIRCAFPNAAATCASGRCGLGLCARGYANCNAMAVDGCEANVFSDPRNCGACGNVCLAQPGFTPVCALGMCRAVMCPVGFSDCDGNAANGCETNLQTSATNCGACGASCARANATNACSAGVCTAPVCVTGFANCDGNALNGCEVSTVTDARNCGACGSVCRMAPGLGTASCAASRCAVACNAGYADCDRNPGNGCESSLNTVTNCGACGRVCGTGQTCSAGNCVLSSLLGSYSSRFFPLPGPAFISACASPGRAVILPSQDDNAQLVPLPFAFRFWNVTYSANTQINVSTNGWLSFEPVIRTNLRGIIPDPTVPNAVVAPFWTDLVTGPGGICVATVGLAPSRQLVIEWTDAQLFSSRGSPLRFEAVLFETTGQINFYYDTVAPVPDTEYVAVGLENPTGVAAHVNCNGSNVCTVGSGGRIAWVPN
jgi:hypothetical protein